MVLSKETQVQEDILNETGFATPSVLELIEQSSFAKLGKDFAFLPMTATDILYNLGFAACDTTAQVPPRFLGATHANLREWNGQVTWLDQTSPTSNFDYLFNMMDDTPAMDEEVVDEMSITDTSFKSAFSFTNSTSRGNSSCSSFESASICPQGKTSGSTSSSGVPSPRQPAATQRGASSSASDARQRPKMIRSHSLPELQTKNTSQSKDQNGSSDKHFPKMKLKRHRSQLCLQQSFDTITEEEEDTFSVRQTTFEKLETIKGSFNQSVDSVAVSVKPSTQCNNTSCKKLDEKMESSYDNIDPFDVSETTETTTSSISSEKKSAKLKRQSCEEIFQDVQEPTTWEGLKSKLEAVERRAWNTTINTLQKERRVLFSKQKGVFSLPVHGCVRIVQPIRRCVTLLAEETETDTSESHSEISTCTRNSIPKPEPDNSFTIPILESDDETTTIESDSAWMAPAITVEQFVTDSSLEEIPASPNGQLALPVFSGRPLSPALSVASEATLIPDDEEIEREKAETQTLVTSSTVLPRKAQLNKMKSSVLFSSLHNTYNSPFYIYTPKLGFRKRSSSMPLLYKPTLVRSKLRRAVTDSPLSLTNIIEEYDADLDDDELLCEQEEWENRIYMSILKSITSCSNEDLLKQIEDRVEGTSEKALKVKRNGRRKKSSFPKSGDEDIPSSSGQEDRLEHLAVKPRRKRRKSRDRRTDTDPHLSPAISPYELISDQYSARSSMECQTPESTELIQAEVFVPLRSTDVADPDVPVITQQDHQSHISSQNDNNSLSAESAKPSCTSGNSDKIVGTNPVEIAILLPEISIKAENSKTGPGRLEAKSSDSKPPQGLHPTLSTEFSLLGYTEERISDIIKEDELKKEDKLSQEDEQKKNDDAVNSLSPSSSEYSPELDKDRTEWELKVLRDAIVHFEEDYAKTEEVLEEKRVRDKRIRMEIKMLKTQIAVYKMEKRLCSGFQPLSASTPRASMLATPRTKSPKSKATHSTTPRARNTLNHFLLNESTFIDK